MSPWDRHPQQEQDGGPIEAGDEGSPAFVKEGFSSSQPAEATVNELRIVKHLMIENAIAIGKGVEEFSKRACARLSSSR